MRVWLDAVVDVCNAPAKAPRHCHVTIALSAHQVAVALGVEVAISLALVQVLAVRRRRVEAPSNAIVPSQGARPQTARHLRVRSALQLLLRALEANQVASAVVVGVAIPLAHV